MDLLVIFIIILVIALVLAVILWRATFVSKENLQKMGELKSDKLVFSNNPYTYTNAAMKVCDMPKCEKICHAIKDDPVLKELFLDLSIYGFVVDSIEVQPDFALVKIKDPDSQIKLRFEDDKYDSMQIKLNDLVFNKSEILYNYKFFNHKIMETLKKLNLEPRQIAVNKIAYNNGKISFNCESTQIELLVNNLPIIVRHDSIDNQRANFTFNSDIDDDFTRYLAEKIKTPLTLESSTI
jgi:hypothetical protein